MSLTVSPARPGEVIHQGRSYPLVRHESRLNMRHILAYEIIDRLGDETSPTEEQLQSASNDAPELLSAFGWGTPVFSIKQLTFNFRN